MSEFWEPPRTRKKIIEDNRAIVRQMASEGATQEDIGEYLGCTRGNISLVYRDEWNAGRGGLQMSVRKWQITKARRGCSDMLKHLGRTYCKDQKDIGGDPLSPGSLTTSVDEICHNSEKVNKEREACGNSVQNKSTSSKIQRIVTTSQSDPSDPGKV
ncbi:MAG TPA: hypothetical protein ENH65_02770 [Candidatus Aminicenantes bacterium]|nr:hypothetical protein [Candidatus Aminicenantes bacterium]